MSRRTRELKRRKARRRTTLIFFIILIATVLISVGYYRSNESEILTPIDYIKTNSSEVYLIKDVKYLVPDNFSNENLNYPEGTKVSGYDVLTNTPLNLNQDFLTNRVSSLEQLINSNAPNDWDSYAQELTNTMSQIGFLNSGDLDYYKQTSCYAPASMLEVQNKLNIFKGLNSSTPIEFTLTKFGIQDTGFIYSGITEYEELANEAVLGNINNRTLDDISHLETKASSAIKLINSDHMFALVSVKDKTLIQGEQETLKLKEQYKQNLNNSSYYNMLITRVDRLRNFPQLSFDYNGQNYPGYLIDIINDSHQKIIVLILKDYLHNLANETKLNVSLNTQNLRAYQVPQSAVIERDGKNYITILQKGYFTHEVEVNVTSYDGNTAILGVDDNPDLTSETSIKIYP